MTESQSTAPPKPPCGEVLVQMLTNDAYVCEADAGTEHSHADLRSYMRPLRDNERTVVDRRCDVVRLVAEAR